MATRNVTLALPADLVRRAKIVAASRDTSLSALVTAYLQRLVEDEDGYAEVWREEQRLMDTGLPMRVGPITWSRADSHER
ncbi:MAG: DUF6364 family protein [Egibacteraceae bacterium]